MKKIFEKYKWLIVIILVLIISYPFICLFINKITSLNLGELYTFDLSLKEFIPIWVAFWGVIGAAIGIWQMQRRIIIQEKQNEKQDNLREEQRQQFDIQIKRQDEQIQIQQKQLRDNRFSVGVELLGNSNVSARIGGIYNLYFLASEFSDEYLNSVCEILCAHIRTITSDDDYQEKYKEKPSNEIQTILDLLFKKKNDKLVFVNCTKTIRRSFLNGANFIDAIIRNTYFSSDNLIKCIFRDANIMNTSFNGALLRDINFKNIEIEKSTFWRTEFNNINFNNAKLRDTIFTEATIKNTFFTRTTFNDVCFREAKIYETHFNHIRIRNYNFGKTEFNKTIFSFHNKNEKENFITILSNDYRIEGISIENDLIEITTPSNFKLANRKKSRKP